MQKKTFITALLLSITILFAGVGIATAVDTPYPRTFCPSYPSYFYGWWAVFYPTYRLCPASYYTWNSTSLGSEESWYKSPTINVLCGQPTPPFGPTTYENVLPRAYIPSPHATQTQSAHYYRWNLSGSYLMIGTINQYNTWGWAYLATTNWNWADQWKLSDWTNEPYTTKTVDLDAFSIECPTP